MLLGTYEPAATPWKISGTPDDFGHDLLSPDIDRISDRLNMSFERIPALADAGIKDVINGPFTFGPDGNPMIGPVWHEKLLGCSRCNGWILSGWWSWIING